MTKNRLICAAGALLAVMTLCFGMESWADTSKKGKAPSALPDGLFVSQAFPSPLGVKAAKENSKQGAEVVVHGRVAGRAVPFVEGRAVFLLADMSMKPCDCHCPTPWDFCCDNPQVIMQNLATVQVLGPDGRPLKAKIQSANGLEPLSEVMIKGTVAKRDLNTFVLNADSIYVKPPSN